MLLQSDGEPATRSLFTAVAKNMSYVSTRKAPSYHSPSQGTVERLHSTLFARVRTLREQVKEDYKVEIDATSPL